jgi:hypothetical protein
VEKDRVKALKKLEEGLEKLNKSALSCDARTEELATKVLISLLPFVLLDDCCFWGFVWWTGWT